jgi:hypothetical protein
MAMSSDPCDWDGTKAGATHYTPPYDKFANPVSAEPFLYGVVGGPDLTGLGASVVPANSFFYLIITKRQPYTYLPYWSYGDWSGIGGGPEVRLSVNPPPP